MRNVSINYLNGEGYIDRELANLYEYIASLQGDLIKLRKNHNYDS